MVYCPIYYVPAVILYHIHSSQCILIYMGGGGGGKG